MPHLRPESDHSCALADNLNDPSIPFRVVAPPGIYVAPAALEVETLAADIHFAHTFAPSMDPAFPLPRVANVQHSGHPTPMQRCQIPERPAVHRSLDIDLAESCHRAGLYPGRFIGNRRDPQIEHTSFGIQHSLTSYAAMQNVGVDLARRRVDLCAIRTLGDIFLVLAFTLARAKR